MRRAGGRLRPVLGGSLAWTRAFRSPQHLLRECGLPPPEGDREDARGRVLVVAGCLEVPGAILLGAEAALRAGAGKVRIATCRDLAVPVGLAMPEARVLALP